MIQTFLSSMITLMLAKFVINDMPHAAGLLANPGYEEPPTPRQLRYIAVLCQRLKITISYEEQVRTGGEAGRMIRELEAEEKYGKKLRNDINPHNLRLERTTTDKILDDLERVWHRIEHDMSIEMQSALNILKNVMGYYYKEPCVAAWDNTNLVGVVVYETMYDRDKGIKFTHIKELASFTREPGVGRAIVEEMVKIGREEGSDIVSVNYGPGARGFYERLGFVKNIYYPDEPTLMMYRL